MSITIYNNPKCSKSREALKILEQSGLDFKVIEYLKNPPSVYALERLCKKLKLNPWNIVRRKEALFKSLHPSLDGAPKNKWMITLLSNPSLIERPIVVDGDRAIIARPPDKLYQFLKLPKDS